MTDKELRKVQLLQLEMAKEVKRICEKYGISYFLDAGSMLGAVRHKGFIPWDDDLDIGFLKEEYDKFATAARTDLNEKYYLHDSSVDDAYGLTFGKIRLRGTRFVENMSEKNSAAKEIYIDLFPYDNRAENEREARKEAAQFRVYAHLLMIKCRMYVWKGQGVKKWLKFLPFCVLSLLYTKQKLRKKIEQITSKHAGERSSEVYIHDGTAAYYWHFPRGLIENLQEAEFEGELFPIPEDYDKFLTIAYGNYMELPPENKRKTHNIIELDFGEW